jgi:ATP-dependent Zn protease
MTIAEAIAADRRAAKLERIRAGIHEAGHVLVADAQGLPVYAARIGAHGGSTWTKATTLWGPDREPKIAMILGGLVAERLASVPEAEARHHASDDLAAATRLAATLVGERAASTYLDVARVDVEALLRRRWTTLTRFASLLVDLGRMEGSDAVREALAWARSDRPRPRKWWRPGPALAL